MIIASLFGSVFAATFLFSHDFILFGYKTERDFHAWAPPLRKRLGTRFNPRSQKI
jgi:hypothetical protein